MKRMKGIVVPMTTPFLENGQLDEQALAANTRWLVDKGVRYLYPCGTTGEMLNMSVQERKTVAEIVVREAGEQADVFVQVGAMTTADTMELAKHARMIGAAGIGVVTPAFFGLDHDELLVHYKAVCSCVGKDFPVYLYNIPQCASNDLDAQLCAEIAEACPNVMGIKYSKNNADRISEYLAIRDYGFSVLVGLERHFLPYLALGCDGVVTGCSNAFPEVFLSLYDAYLAGDMEKALKLQRLADKLVSVITRSRSNACVKAAQNFRGQQGGHMRLPLRDIPQEKLGEYHKEFAAFLPENWSV